METLVKMGIFCKKLFQKKSLKKNELKSRFLEKWGDFSNFFSKNIGHQNHFYCIIVSKTSFSLHYAQSL